MKIPVRSKCFDYFSAIQSLNVLYVSLIYGIKTVDTICKVVHEQAGSNMPFYWVHIFFLKYNTRIIIFRLWLELSLGHLTTLKLKSIKKSEIPQLVCYV